MKPRYSGSRQFGKPAGRRRSALRDQHPAKDSPALAAGLFACTLNPHRAAALPHRTEGGLPAPYAIMDGRSKIPTTGSEDQQMRGYNIWRPLMVIIVALLMRNLVTGIGTAFGMGAEAAAGLGMVAAILSALFMYTQYTKRNRK